MIYNVRVFENGSIDYKSEPRLSSSYEYVTMLTGYIKIDSKESDWSDGHLTVRNVNEFYIDIEHNFDSDNKQIIDLVNKIKGLERDKKLSNLLS